MNTNAYIIEKVFVEVNTENMATATALKDHMSVLLEQRILPELEKILDEWNQPDKVVRFPTFHLDVQIPADHFEDRLAEAVTVQFAQQMKQVFGSGDGAGVPYFSFSLKKASSPGMEQKPISLRFYSFQIGKSISRDPLF